MIVCPNCNHQNPDGAIQCEACYTPLPSTTSCPNCGASVQTDASFCGQCGSNLKGKMPMGGNETSATNPLPDLPELVNPDPLVEIEPVSMIPQVPEPEQNATSPPAPEPNSQIPATIVSQPGNSGATNPPANSSPPTPPTSGGGSHTQLQVQSAKLLHLQTNTPIELPQNLSVIHIGKSNEQIPPDIDVGGFPNSEIVSRIHADIRVEGDTYYIEDVGSSNGTYINHTPLAKGNRHRLRPGDRIALGKGDQVTFLFQMS